jgi:hypothetical protein
MRLRVILVVLFVLFFAAFLIRSSVTQDPDFGWHLQFGRLLTTTHKIPVTDPYSYSMPSYHFVNHEWGTDILIAAVYDSFGMWPLFIASAIIGIATLFIISKGINLRWSALLFFLVGGTLFDFIGVRPQIVSWLFLAILSTLIFQKAYWQRFRFFVPLFFLLWTNLHGGFAFGIVIVGIFVFGQMVERRTFDLKNLAVFIFSLLATFCNPYGYHLWTEILKSANDPQLRNTLQEWYPAIYFSNIAFWIYWAISFYLVLKYRKKYTLTELFLYFFLLIAAFLSIRNIPVWIIASFAMTARGMAFLYQEASTHKYGSDRFLTAYIVFSFFAFIFFLPQLGGFFYGLYVSKDNASFYPAAAVSYLHNHLPRQQIFSSYDWGGYLIWQLPEKKVFIDGRMPSWRWHATIKGESNYAFDDYKKVLTGQTPFASFAKKYHISTLLIPIAELAPPETKLLGITIGADNPLHFLLVSYKSFYGVVGQARQAGWREVYHDQTAIVFEK